MLSWQLPIGFYTGIAVEECFKGSNCNIHTLIRNKTNLELQAGAHTYRLIVYQYGKEVVMSQPFAHDTTLHSKH